MSALRLLSAEAIETPPPRIDVPQDVQQASASIATTANGIASRMGRSWTTPTAQEQARADLVRLARDALNLLEKL